MSSDITTRYYELWEGLADALSRMEELLGTACECDNTHAANGTTCAMCWYRSLLARQPQAEPELVAFTLADSQMACKYVHGQIRIEPHGGGVALRFDGYGTYDVKGDGGFPVFVERYNGRLQLLVFADINEQEPQVINLDGAWAKLYRGDE
ncbi:MAG: hypothetical protein FOGNACKC_00825 [Anaerolineae bacterium]|nr:hypothetical protein [Anaerolineae bacterium]